MSAPLISRSADLRRLIDEGYELEVAHGHTARPPPSRTSRRTRKCSTALWCRRSRSRATRHTTPDTHVMLFAGGSPCRDARGRPLSRIIHSAGRQQLAEGIAVDFLFSSKPASGYADYYEKVTAYVAMLAAPAQRLDPAATASTYRVATSSDNESVFEYMDTASPRAGIAMATAKLAIGKVAIVGIR